MHRLSRIVEQGIAEKTRWDFYEDAETAAEDALETVPGRLITGFYESTHDLAAVEHMLGLLTTYAARRSLVCWFAYCDDTKPLWIANRLVDFWTGDDRHPQFIEEAWTEEIAPAEKGIPIVDCRWCDTFSASSAVTNAAKFARTRSRLDAITSLSDSNEAFNQSPIGSVRPFREWLMQIAIPAAAERRALSAQEQFALADFRVPEIFAQVE